MGQARWPGWPRPPALCGLDDDSRGPLSYPTHRRVNAARRTVVDTLFVAQTRKYSIRLDIRWLIVTVGLSAPGDCPNGPASGVIHTEIQHLLNFRFISRRKQRPRGGRQCGK
jgi:hypothetical protein